MLYTTAFLSTLFFSGAAYGQQPGNENPQGNPQETPQAPQDTQNGQTPQGMVNVHVVQVSNEEGSKKFYPESIQANPGEMVQFQFHPENHSVVQADFSAPCTPINEVNPDVVGVKSGFMPMEAGSNEMPVFTMMVNSTDPMWLYCGAEGHCQNGMVMAINAAEEGEKTLASYKAAAEDAESGAVPPGAGAPGDDSADAGENADAGAGDGADTGDDAGAGNAPADGNGPADGGAGTDADGNNADGTNADGADAENNAGNAGSGDADSDAATGAASGSPTESAPPVSTGGASSMQTMSGAGLAGLFVACAAFIGM